MAASNRPRPWIIQIAFFKGQVPQIGRGSIQLEAWLSNKFGLEGIFVTHHLDKSWLNDHAW